MIKYNPCSKEFQEEAKRLGLTGFQYVQKLREDGKLVNITDFDRKIRLKKIKDAGCKTETEYKNKCAQTAGFKDYAERVKEISHNAGRNFPKEFNEDCSHYFGDFTEKSYDSDICRSHKNALWKSWI